MRRSSTRLTRMRHLAPALGPTAEPRRVSLMATQSADPRHESDVSCWLNRSRRGSDVFCTDSWRPFQLSASVRSPAVMPTVVHFDPDGQLIAVCRLLVVLAVALQLRPFHTASCC